MQILKIKLKHRFWTSNIFILIFRRPHRHKGCRKSQNSVGGVFATDDTKMVSDYKSRFGQIHYVAPVEAIRPMQRPRDPNPPPMDLRTENQMAYKVFDNVDRIKPCKVKKSFNKFFEVSKYLYVNKLIN